MSNLSAKELAGAAKLSSWIPQVFFDVIARMIPGSLGLVILAAAFAGPSESALFVSNWLNKNLGFPSILFILVTVSGFSYIYAVSMWGLWYGLCALARRVGILDKRADPETCVFLEEQGFPELYERIKASNPVAGNRLTKLKAEIHMVGTLLVSGLFSLVFVFFQPSPQWLYFFAAIVAGLVGLFLALVHFARRSTQIVKNAETICSVSDRGICVICGMSIKAADGLAGTVHPKL